MIKSIILVGGFGSRLRSITKETPKPLIICNKYPFIKYLIDFQYNQGIRDFIFATFYKSSMFESFVGSFKNIWPKANFKIIKEKNKLGTGGAIKNAISSTNGDHYLVSNGDSYIKYDINSFIDIYKEKKCDGSVLLTKKNSTEARFGSVEVLGNYIKHFNEKPSISNLSDFESTFINAGIYLLNKDLFDKVNTKKFSFEKNVLSNENFKFSYLISKSNFIDIGIEKDLKLFKKNLNDYI